MFNAIRFGVFYVKSEHISHLCSSVSIVNFEQVNAGWVVALRTLSSSHFYILDAEVVFVTVNDQTSNPHVVICHKV